MSTRPDPTPDEVPALRDPRLGAVPFRVVHTTLPQTPEESAALQGIPLAALLRTIVVRRAADDYLFVLVPAGRRFDWPKVRAHLGVSRISLPDADEARDATGYVRYSITPFGANHPWPVILDASAIGETVVSIGGGVRGVNLHLAPRDLADALHADIAEVTASADTAADP